MTEIKRLTPTELRDGGYLQEANRIFFHPLGLAMEIALCTHEATSISMPDGPCDVRAHTPEECPWPNGVWIQIQDWREDEEGVFFDLTNPPESAKALKIQTEWNSREPARVAYAREHGLDVYDSSIGPIQGDLS